jgi:hypothetical protein
VPAKPAPRPKGPILPHCPECDAVAAEPRLRYCENCGARMPEYKSPTTMMAAAGGEGAQGAGDIQGEEEEVRKRPPYTGPKWLEHVPGHSPSVLGVVLHWVALGLSVIPALASVGKFWSFVMLLGSILVVFRELRATGERNPLVDAVPESITSPAVTAVYTAMAVGLCLPMLELSVQPLLWLGGTALLVKDQWGKVFAGPRGYLRLFDPRSLVRGQKLLALVGVSVCMLALLFPWIEIKIGGGNGAVSSVAGLRPTELPRQFDSVYNGLEDVRTAGIDRPVAPTVVLGLLALLVIVMLRPEVDRPEWLRFVPAGITVISLAWGLVNMKPKLGPIMFLAGLVPIALIAFMTALRGDEPVYEEDYPPGPPDDGQG